MTPSRRTRIFAGAIIVLGLPVLVFSLFATASQPPGWVLLALGAGLSGFFPVRLPRLGARGDSLRVTVSDVFVFLGVLLYSPATGVVVGAIDSALSNKRTRSPLRYAFNLSLVSVATFCAGSLFYALRGTDPPLDPGQVSQPELYLLQVALCALLYFALSSSIVSLTVSLQTGAPWLSIWRQDLFWSALIGFTQAVTAAAIVLGSETTQVLMAGVLIPIVLMTYYAHRLHSDRLHSLEHSRAFLQSTLDSLGSAVAILDESGTIMAANAVWEDTTDRHPLIGHPVGEDYIAICRRRRPDLETESNALASGIEGLVSGRRTSFSSEYRWESEEATRWFATTITRFKEAPLRLVVAHEEITERKQAQLRVLRLSYFDDLTGLPNRDFFGERIKQIARLAGPGAPRKAVLSLSLNNFRKVSDTLGHRAGDLVLTETARRLRECIERIDPGQDVEDGIGAALMDRADRAIFRTGVDEFCVLLGSAGRRSDVTRTCREIISALTEPFALGGEEAFVTVSVGIAYPILKHDASELLRSANSARQRAAEKGKNAYEFYSEALQTRSKRALTIESSLHRALERGELSVQYQPRVGLQDGEVAGMEALMRWKHPEMGRVSPVDFIPVAEETGLIVPFGRWILEQACRQNAHWSNRDRPLRVSVNVSSEQFRNDDLRETLSDVLGRTGMDPSLLELEITETLLMQEQEEVCRVLADIRRLGVKIALDDFGTGYSALVYLTRFPVDTVKIDRSFIRQIGAGSEPTSIVKAIVALCHSLDLSVVAEGVESPDQLRFLRDQRCDEVQGFLFSRPLSPAEFEAWLGKHESLLQAPDIGLAGTG